MTVPLNMKTPRADFAPSSGWEGSLHRMLGQQTAARCMTHRSRTPGGMTRGVVPVMAAVESTHKTISAGQVELSFTASGGMKVHSYDPAHFFTR